MHLQGEFFHPGIAAGNTASLSKELDLLAAQSFNSLGPFIPLLCLSHTVLSLVKACDAGASLSSDGGPAMQCQDALTA